MPKSKSNKKRKNKVVAFRNKLQADRRKLKNAFIQSMQEARTKEMEEQIKAAQNEQTVEGLGDFSLDDNQPTIPTPPPSTDTISEGMGLSELGLGDIQQVELQGAPPDSFSGVIK